MLPGGEYAPKVSSFIEPLRLEKSKRPEVCFFSESVGLGTTTEPRSIELAHTHATSGIPIHENQNGLTQDFQPLQQEQKGCLLIKPLVI